jgi:hypothetical protein
MAKRSVNWAFSKRSESGGRIVLGVGFLLACFAAAAAAAAVAQGPPIKPYKDDLFQNVIIRTLYNGDMRFIEYSKKRDLYGRDKVVEKKAFDEYVSLEPDDVQQDLVLRDRGRIVRYVGVGRTGSDARFVVLFLHGGNGSRFQAVDDWSFGGNFNRLKNLVTRNDGVYLSPDFSLLQGKDDIKELMAAYAAKSPGAPIIVACTSLSGELCFDLMADKDTAPLLGGILLLGSLVKEKGFFASPIFTDPDRHIPIFIGHGSKDTILDWVTQELFFKKVKAAAPDYPIRFDLFVNGLHGTPMRLTDWRRVLNWMIGADGGLDSAH